MSNQIQESINKAIDTIVNRRINALALDKTVIAIIDSVINSLEGTYRVQYEGGYFDARAQYNNTETYSKGMAVYVQIPQNDTTKEKIIIGRAYNLRDTIEADVAISAINNYSIIGNNSFIVNDKNKNEIGIALRSYHDPATETETNNLIQHRAQLIYDDKKQSTYLYSLNKNNLNLYLKNATALMVEADFRTMLNSEQQLRTDGSFGIGLNLVFNNSNYEFGRTQGEIFDYFASDINMTFESVNANGTPINISRSLASYDNTIREAIKENSTSTYANLIANDGILDMNILYIKSLIDSYSLAYQDQWIPKEAEITNAYIILIQSLKQTTNKAEMVSLYNEWRNRVVGDDSEKTVFYVLDSDSMVGNPYNYTSWSTQYAIFDIDIKNFKRIENILFYKNGFKTDESMCQHGEDTNNNGIIKENADGPKEDIFLRNLKIYALQPLSAEKDNYRLDIQAKETGLIFNSVSNSETLEVQAKVTKLFYEDLSNYVKFYWFKQNSTVNSVTHSSYQEYGGIGWAYLSKTNEKKITLVGSENRAYENKYKCVAVIDKETVLSDTFIVYNTGLMTEIKLESNLGTNFSFDTGAPLIKCLVKTKTANNYTENTSSTFRYYWAIQIDGKITFLDKLTPSLDPSTEARAEDLLKIQNLSNLVKDVTFYKSTNKITNESNLYTATRIQYPVKNIALAVSAIFICFVQQNVNGIYHDIGSAELTINNVDNPEVNEFRIVLENGSQVFQYDEYGNAPNSKKLKDPLTIKPVICHLFNPTGLEVPNSNYDVEWIVPIENSLLTFKNVTLNPNPTENNIENINPKKQCVFNILTTYNEDYQDNVITCRVKYNEKIFEKTTSFYFGKSGDNGTNGTDVVLRMMPRMSLKILEDQPLTLYRYNYNSSTEKYSNTIFNSGETTKTIANGLNAGVLQMKLYQKGEEITNIGSCKWNIAGNPYATQNKGKNLNLSFDNSTITWSETFPSNSSDFNSAFSNYIIRGMINYNNKSYYGFYSLPIISYRSATLPAYSRVAINNKTLLKEVVYNADGRNPIYSHEQGVELINVPSNYSVSWIVRGGKNDNSASIKILPTKDTSKNNAVTSYTTAVGKQHRIWILPDDEYSGAYCNNRVIATIKQGSTIIAEVIVPIHLTLNTFGLASLNAWDGNSVTIDEEGGYILAPQIGAGEKDLNNRFTGILMGKTETRTGRGSKEKEIGLFGYAHGLQSIFLDAETGEAYFGLPDGTSLSYGNWDVQNPDTYNEGRVELKPGGVSKVGGWRLGRQSLYYTSSGDIGNKYKNDYIPNKDGKISNGNAYNTHHIKDIKESDSGILIHAGTDPYISIKGRALYPTQGDKDLLSSSSESYLKDGDSLEIQLDPRTPTLFSVFRHNGQERWKKDKNGILKLLYPINSRTFLAGINGRGQLVANSLQSIAQNTNTSTSVSTDTVTTFGVDAVAAFGENIETATHVGLKMMADDNMIGKLFAKDDGKNNSTLYISGSGSETDEYIRPLSLHGSTISLYAKDNNINTSNSATEQNSRIIISNSNFYAGNVGEGYISINRSGSGTSSIYTPDNFKLTSVKGAIDILATDGKITTKAQNGSVEINAWSNSRNGNGADLKLENTGNTTLNSGQSITLNARVWDSINKKYTIPAFLTISNTSNSELQSANNIFLYAKNNNNNVTPYLMLNSASDTSLNSAAGLSFYTHNNETQSGRLTMYGQTNGVLLESSGNIELYTRKLRTSPTGKIYDRIASFTMNYPSPYEWANNYPKAMELKSAGGIRLIARTFTESITAEPVFQETASFTMLKDGNTTLSSAGSIYFYAQNEGTTTTSLYLTNTSGTTLNSNGSIIFYAKKDGTNTAWLSMPTSGNTSLQSAGDIYLRTPIDKTKNKYPAELTIREAGNSLLRSAADMSILAGSSIGIYAGAGIDNTSSSNGIYLPVASVFTTGFLKSVRPFDISSIGNMNIKANNGNSGGKLSLESDQNSMVIKAGTNLDIDSGAGITMDAASGSIFINVNGASAANAFQVYTNHGSLSIQKSNDYKYNLLYSSNLGLHCKFGYFNGTVGSTQAYKDYSIYASQGIYSGNKTNSATFQVRTDNPGENAKYAHAYELYGTQKISKTYTSNDKTSTIEISGASIGALLESILIEIGAVNNYVKKVDGNLDSFKQNVSNTYATKQSLEDALKTKADATSLTNHINSTNTHGLDAGTVNNHINSRVAHGLDADTITNSIDDKVDWNTYNKHKHGASNDWPYDFVITDKEMAAPHVTIDGNVYYVSNLSRMTYTTTP